MSHTRTQIRDAVMARLTGLTTTGVNVFVDPVRDFEQSKLPMLVLTTGSESISTEAQIGQRVYQRVLSLSIEAIASPVSGLADVLDQIALEVEAAINADVRLGGVSLDAVLVSINQQFEKAERSVGRLSLEYEITYVTEA